VHQMKFVDFPHQMISIQESGWWPAPFGPVQPVRISSGLRVTLGWDIQNGNRPRVPHRYIYTNLKFSSLSDKIIDNHRRNMGLPISARCMRKDGWIDSRGMKNQSYDLFYRKLSRGAGFNPRKVSSSTFKTVETRALIDSRWLISLIEWKCRMDLTIIVIM
jgi:hypothetical protein